MSTQKDIFKSNIISQQASPLILYNVGRVGMTYLKITNVYIQCFTIFRKKTNKLFGRNCTFFKPDVKFFFGNSADFYLLVGLKKLFRNKNLKNL